MNREDKHIVPPKLAEWFFLWYCRNNLRESILGDLLERFEEDVQRFGTLRARLKYWSNVFRFINRYTLKNSSTQNLRSSQMAIYNQFLLSSFRHLLKHKKYALLNILGLVVGIAGFVIIEAYVRHERSYDQFFHDADLLYRTSADNFTKDGILESSESMGWVPQGEALKNEFPEIVAYTTVRKHFETTSIRFEDQVFGEDLVLAVDEGFLQLFNHPLVTGSASRLSEPNTVILSSSTAAKYFGSEEAVGKFIEVQSYWENEGPFEVVGVVEDVPSNTHLKFDVLISLASMRIRTDQDAWNCLCYYTYFKVDLQSDIVNLEEKVAAITPKYLGEESNLRFGITPVKDIHLKSSYTFEPEPPGDQDTVNFMEIIAFVILLIAWINYINLSTAKAVNRSREVGIRKVIGARKSQLFTQFLTESFILNLISVTIAFVVIQFILPMLGTKYGMSFGALFWDQSFLWIALVLVLVIGTLVAGIYPAVVMSSFPASQVLKSSKGASGVGNSLRKALVVFQYMASFSLITGTLVVNEQLKFMRNADMGIDVSQVLAIENPVFTASQSQTYGNRLQLFQDRLKQNSGVREVGFSYGIPGTDQTGIGSTYGARLEDMAEPKPMAVYVIQMDEGFIPALDVEIIAGRNFDKRLQSDTAAVILNETFIKNLGISDPGSLIDRKIRFGTRPDAREWLIAGIIKDFNRMALRNSIEPTVYIHSPVERPLGFGHQVVKIASTDLTSTVTAIENIWQEIFTETPFDYVFVDENVAQAYAQDDRQADLFLIFASLAIFIAGLGLVGLSSFIALQRSREIGIRKTLGASVQSILALLGMNFLRLFITGSLLCLPLTYWVLSGWLEGYAYRIEFPWWTIILSAILLVLITVLTIGRQTVQAALTNPVKVLRND